ncbi:MAG: tetratricopeptide repeat protein [Clostridiales bacterium]|nr:tetratricopeptide repeat protein [Clostridiales bacterium]
MSLFGNLIGNLAYWRHLRGKVEMAEKTYAKAYVHGMTDPVKLGTYGVLLLRKGEYEDALMLFNQALKNRALKPKVRLQIRMNRSLAYFKLGEIEKAIVALEDIHKKNRSLRVYQSLGYVYIMAGEYEKAMEYNLEALEYDDEDPVILDNMGQLHYALGEYDKAREYFEKAFSYKQNQVDILYHLSVIEEHDGNAEKALYYASLANDCAINTLNDVTPDEVRQRYARLSEQAANKSALASVSGPEQES